MMWMWLLLGCEPAEVQFLPDLWNQDQWETGGVDNLDTGAGTATRLEIDDDTVAWGCTNAGTAWELGFRTRWSGGGGELHLFSHAAWTEAHPLVLIDASATGNWDTYAVGPLVEGASTEAFVAGTNTTFACETSRPTAVLVLDDRLGNHADCVQFGADTTTSTDFLAAEQLSCRIITPITQ